MIPIFIFVNPDDLPDLDFDLDLVKWEWVYVVVSFAIGIGSMVYLLYRHSPEYPGAYIGMGFFLGLLVGIFLILLGILGQMLWEDVLSKIIRRF